MQPTGRDRHYGPFPGVRGVAIIKYDDKATAIHSTKSPAWNDWATLRTVKNVAGQAFMAAQNVR